jgi:hypothetical protein
MVALPQAPEPTATSEEISQLHNLYHSRSANYDICENGILLPDFESDNAPKLREGKIECRVEDNSVFIDCSKLSHEFFSTDRFCAE